MPPASNHQAISEAIRSEILSELKSGLQHLGLDYRDEMLDRFFTYLVELQRWNQSINLTAIRDLRRMVSLHLLDSLSVAPYVTGARVVDVGTGPGLPGLPLAILFANKHFTLIDSNGKKIRFLRHVLSCLQLEHVEIIQERVEKFQPETKFDNLTCRAFASLTEIVTLTRHLLAPAGRILALKGIYPEGELRALPDDVLIVKTVKLDVPGVDADRHLVILEPM